MSDWNEEIHAQALELAQARAVHELAKRLIDVGDTHVLSLEVGESAAGQALHYLTERAPRDLQGSWAMVIAWHRFGDAYQVAKSLGDSAGMVKAEKEQLNLVTRRYG